MILSGPEQLTGPLSGGGTGQQIPHGPRLRIAGAGARYTRLGVSPSTDIS
jgi:hypothetical protein